MTYPSLFLATVVGCAFIAWARWLARHAWVPRAVRWTGQTLGAFLLAGWLGAAIGFWRASAAADATGPVHKAEMLTEGLTLAMRATQFAWLSVGSTLVVLLWASFRWWRDRRP